MQPRVSLALNPGYGSDDRLVNVAKSSSPVGL